MADNKSLGCDGFPYEFQKHLLEYIGLDLHKFYLEAYHSKSLGAIINNGNIKFIPKDGDPDDIYNWRPISFLMCYIILFLWKFLSKFTILHLIIWTMQTGFTKY